jgi:hypothetical protein
MNYQPPQYTTPVTPSPTTYHFSDEVFGYATEMESSNRRT